MTSKATTTTTTTTTSGHTKVRHIRIPDDIWDDSGELATSEGYTLSQVTRQLLDAYRNGEIKLTAKRVRR